MWLLIVGPAGALALIVLMVAWNGGSGDVGTDAIYRRLPGLLMRPAAVVDGNLVRCALIFGAAYAAGLAALWRLVSHRGCALPVAEAGAAGPDAGGGPAHPPEVRLRNLFAGVPPVLPVPGSDADDFISLARSNLARRSSFGA